MWNLYHSRAALFWSHFWKNSSSHFFWVEQCKIRQIKATSPLFEPRQNFADEQVHGLDHVVLHKPTPTSDAPGTYAEKILRRGRPPPRSKKSFPALPPLLLALGPSERATWEMFLPRGAYEYVPYVSQRLKHWFAWAAAAFSSRMSSQTNV